MATTADAKKEIAYVRGEKKEDDSIARKLEEVYGKAAAVRDNGYRRTKHGWACASCGYVNYESRLACGECLELHPEVAEGTRFQRKPTGKKSNVRPSAGDDTASTAGSVMSSNAAIELLNRQPNIKQAAQSNDKFTKILEISGRCYRTADFPSNAVALGRRKAPVKAQVAVVETDDVDPEEDGFGTCSEGGDEDGPAGGCGGPGRMPAYGEALEDFSDDEDGDHPPNGSAPGPSSEASAGGAVIRRDKDADSFTAKMYVSPLMYGFIIGKKGAALAETQRLTNTIIKVPRNDTKGKAGSDESQTIVIKGPDRASVTAAVVRIEAIVLDNRSKVGFTHFISIPIGKDSEVQAKASAVITDMKAHLVSEARRIDPSIFQDPSWMHWTVLVLRLHTQQELDLAKRLLSNEVRKAAAALFAGGAPRTVRLQGLDIMNDDCKEANVVFVKAQESTDGGTSVVNLRSLVATVGDIFLRNKLCQPSDVTRADKLHVTLLNSKFRSTTKAESESKAPAPRVPFDASEVVSAYAGAFFGDYKLHRLELSRMNNHGVGDAAHQATRSSMSYYAMEEEAEF